VSTSPVVNTTNSTKTGVKLNPAHGQPGHRCDLAVGVPLDSKPEVIEVPMKPADGTNTPVVVNTAPAKVAPGMNPSHGQPGHRCDIAVGAPLNSPPGNAAAPAVSSCPAPTISQAPAA